MLGKVLSPYGIGNTFAAFLISVVTLFLVMGCAGGNYGTFDRDRDLDNMYLRYEFLPDHLYYTSGGYDAPNAILAIHRDYELDNSANLWVPIPNMNSAQMRKWIDTIAPEQNYRYSGAYFASYILAPDGKRVGAWYSFASSTTVKFLGDNKIQVYTPDPNNDMFFNKGFMLRSGP